MEIEPEVLECMEDMITKIVHRESNRKYREKNKGKRKEYFKQYRQKNKDKIKEYSKEYHEKNKEQIKDQRKEYLQTPIGLKLHRISNWKNYGVVCDNWDAMYDHYTNTTYCDICRVELSIKKERSANTKVLDHDHSITDRPNFRNILCNSCNVKI